MNIFTQFFKKGSNDNHAKKQAILKDLMRRESEAAKDLLGGQPKKGQRDFFCLDKNTWIWYEEWVDENKQKHQITTKYLIRPNEIVKSKNGGAYHRLSLKEASNFQKATSAYVDKVKSEVYATR